MREDRKARVNQLSPTTSPTQTGKLRFFAIFVLLFLPSAWFAWDNRDMPNFGFYHDDGIYYSGAKSLVQSGSYRIEHYPGTPYQTKYPPLLSVWHSLAWLIEPQFPANLHVAIWLQWIWLPVFAWLAWKLAEQWGFVPYQRWLVVAAIAISPYPLFFSTAVLSEIPFGVLLAATMLLLGRDRVILAAVVAGLAFLTRTAGIVLLVSVPIVFLLQRRWRDSVRFSMVLLPFVAGWLIWSKLHQLPGQVDDLTLYYVNYLGYHFRVFTFAEAHLFLWKNIDFLLQSAGSFLLPVVFSSQIAKITTQVLGVAAIVGAFRLTRQKPEAAQFGVFAALYAVILLAWSFPPNERFLLPLVPLLYAGYIVEFSRVAKAMQISFSHKDRSQRIAGYGVSAFFCGLIAFAIYTQLDIRFTALPASMQKERERVADAKPMYDWIRENTDPKATFMVGYDTPFFLSTGRHSSYHILSPISWYRDETQKAYMDAEVFARAHGFSMILWTPLDRRNDVPMEDQIAIGKKLAASRTLKLVHETRNNYLFELLPVDRKSQ